MILHGVDLRGGAEDEPVLVARIAIGNRTRHGCAGTARDSGTHQLVRESKGLAITVEVIEVEPPGKLVASIAGRGAGLPAGETIIAAIDGEVLAETRERRVH